MPSAHLDVEVTREQGNLLRPCIDDIRAGTILRDAGSAGAMRKLAKRKLDAAGAINAYSWIVNDLVRLRALGAVQALRRQWH